MPEAGTSFTRSRAVRVASGLASFGVVVGFSLVAASPASAATDADCTPLNTVDATTGAPTVTLPANGNALVPTSGYEQRKFQLGFKLFF